MKHRWWQQGLPRSRWTWREDTRACGHLQMKRGNLRNLGSVGECGVQEYTFPLLLTQPAPFSALSCSLSPFLSLQPSHVILACSPLPALIPLSSFLTLNTLQPSKAECSLQWSQPSPSASGFQFNTPSFFIKMFISLFYFYSVLLSHIEFSVL